MCHERLFEHPRKLNIKLTTNPSYIGNIGLTYFLNFAKSVTINISSFNEDDARIVDLILSNFIGKLDPTIFIELHRLSKQHKTRLGRFI